MAKGYTPKCLHSTAKHDSKAQRGVAGVRVAVDAQHGIAWQAWWEMIQRCHTN